MNREIRVFIIRVVAGVVFGALLTLFFHPGAGMVSALELAALLVGFAYLLDYFRSDKSGQ